MKELCKYICTVCTVRTTNIVDTDIDIDIWKLVSVCVSVQRSPHEYTVHHVIPFPGSLEFEFMMGEIPCCTSSIVL